ncbi:MAG TPA: efflux RND transporter periplasmic adaptor subunit [Tepidisphaeraceae bacterium]|jgi:multidrug resistance efflux pump|nr:efflux RND transporter periplasmic adaptor subunit [Tepidisphaeraceae bacterium]
MFRKFLLPALAGIGVLFAIFVVVKGSKPTPVAPAAGAPSTPPVRKEFIQRIAGTGMVEANSQNIAVAANVPGVIAAVYVKVGDAMKAGTPLFKLDDRTLAATLLAEQASLKQASEKLARLEAAPRPEEVPPAEALVREAQANYSDAKNQLDSAESLGDARAISREEVTRRRFAVQATESKLVNAQATLALLKAGTWKPDIEVARADVDFAKSQVQSTQTAIDLLTVKAPVDGSVLQMNARVGEYAQAGPLATPLILFGDVDRLRVRVDVDENEARRIKPHAMAVAMMRGDPDKQTALHFEYIEPFITPKKSLTGDSTERVDTRVLQVIYSFDRKGFPVYVGQQVDVFISEDFLEDGQPAAKSAAPATNAAGAL